VKTDLTTLFAATAFVVGKSPEDAGSAEMTRFQLELIEFWQSQMRADALMGPYERREMLKLYFYWEQAESLLASVRVHD
jgi:hypothetical protein